ncbi:MAG: type II secretion system protein [Desulfobacterales bacterium]|nr:type II secretion system protein [Desulfobacterales bacterium]
MNNSKGFTIIEIVVTLVLIGILAASVGFGIGASVQGYMFNVENVRIMQKAENAILRLTKELNDMTDIDNGANGSNGYIRYKLEVESPYYKAIVYDSNNREIRLRENPAGDCSNSTCGTAARNKILLDKVSAFRVRYEYPAGTWNNFPPSDFSRLLRMDITITLVRYDAIDQLNTFNIIISPRSNGMVTGPT